MYYFNLKSTSKLKARILFAWKLIKRGELPIGMIIEKAKGIEKDGIMIIYKLTKQSQLVKNR